ncbi:hypothetical protein C8J56DRAFT_929053 [Mycena floridula]|nr:hypothetical protein C8J56DRAFT_929053 [Mycena floridula]
MALQPSLPLLQLSQRQIPYKADGRDMSVLLPQSGDIIALRLPGHLNLGAGSGIITPSSNSSKKKRHQRHYVLVNDAWEDDQELTIMCYVTRTFSQTPNPAEHVAEMEQPIREAYIPFPSSLVPLPSTPVAFGQPIHATNFISPKLQWLNIREEMIVIKDNLYFQTLIPPATVANSELRRIVKYSHQLRITNEISLYPSSSNSAASESRGHGSSGSKNSREKKTSRDKDSNQGHKDSSGHLHSGGGLFTGALNSAGTGTAQWGCSAFEGLHTGTDDVEDDEQSTENGSWDDDANIGDDRPTIAGLFMSVGRPDLALAELNKERESLFKQSIAKVQGWMTSAK